jgi:hypothetical protein
MSQAGGAAEASSMMASEVFQAAYAAALYAQQSRAAMLYGTMPQHGQHPQVVSLSLSLSLSLALSLSLSRCTRSRGVSHGGEVAAPLPSLSQLQLGRSLRGQDIPPAGSTLTAPVLSLRRRRS